MDRLKFYLNKYRSVLLYLFFGVLTTVVNLAIYFFFTKGLHVNYLISNGVAWAGAVLLAYVTNRIWVFESRKSGVYEIFTEFFLFIGGRVASGLGETFILWAGVQVLGLPDGMVKLAASIFVVISNYVISKLVVFRK